MDRLTKRDTDGQAMMDCLKCEADWTGKHGKPMVDCTALYCRNLLKARLAAYEDTGLTPEEVNDAVVGAKLMAKAKVVSAFGVPAERLRELAEADKAGRLVVLPCKVGDTVYTLLRTFDGADVVGETELWWTDIPQLGKTVFLTREEAEKELEAMKVE